MEEQHTWLRRQIEFLENRLADKEAEIIRLTTLLGGQAKGSPDTVRLVTASVAIPQP